MCVCVCVCVCVREKEEGIKHQIHFSLEGWILQEKKITETKSKCSNNHIFFFL